MHRSLRQAILIPGAAGETSAVGQDLWRRVDFSSARNGTPNLGEVAHRLSAPLPWGAMPTLQGHRKSLDRYTLALCPGLQTTLPAAKPMPSNSEYREGSKKETRWLRHRRVRNGIERSCKDLIAAGNALLLSHHEQTR